VPIDVSTLSGAVIDAGMSVVIFILGGWAASAAVMLAAIKPVTARMINDLAFILFSPCRNMVLGSTFPVSAVACPPEVDCYGGTSRVEGLKRVPSSGLNVHSAGGGLRF
jgi:hypothetical protein